LSIFWPHLVAPFALAFLNFFLAVFPLSTKGEADKMLGPSPPSGWSFSVSDMPFLLHALLGECHHGIGLSVPRSLFISHEASPATRFF